MMADKTGRKYAKLATIKHGDTIEIDSHFTCAQPGFHTAYDNGDGHLYFMCEDGKHYLDGQADDGIHCVGVYIPR